MQYFPHRTYKITSLILPGDTEALKKEPRIVKLSTSIAKCGILNAPLVEKDTKKLIAGRDRIAAAMLVGDEEVVCRPVLCSPDEFEMLQLTENAYRRYDKKEMANYTKRLVDLYEKSIDYKPPEKKPGRNVSKRTLAREQAAKDLDLKPDTVRKIDASAQKGDDTPTKKGKPEEPDVPSVMSFGMELEPEFEAQIRETKMAADILSNKVTAALTHLTKMETAGLPLPPHTQRVRQELQEVGSVIRGVLVPVSICPYCKAVENIQADCVPCYTRGWVGSSVLHNCPPELTATEPLIVVHNGEQIELELEDPFGELGD